MLCDRGLQRRDAALQPLAGVVAALRQVLARLQDELELVGVVGGPSKLAYARRQDFTCTADEDVILRTLP